MTVWNGTWKPDGTGGWHTKSDKDIVDQYNMDEITRQNLKAAYHSADDDELRNALDLVINYFSNQADYQKWVEEKLNYTK